MQRWRDSATKQAQQAIDTVPSPITTRLGKPMSHEPAKILDRKQAVKHLASIVPAGWRRWKLRES